MTIKELAESMAIPINKQFDEDYMALLYSLIKNWRVKLLKQKLDHKSMLQYLQSFDLELEDYKIENLKISPISNKIKKSKYRLPKHIHNPSFNGPYWYVGSIDQVSELNYSRHENMKYIAYNKLTSLYPRYSISNGFIYVYEYDNYNLKIEGYFEEPVEAGKFNNCININTNVNPEELFIHRDLAQTIISGVQNDLRLLRQDTVTNEIESENS